MPGTINIKIILSLINAHIKFDFLKDIIIILLVLNDNIDLTNFSISLFTNSINDIILNHDLISIIIENGFVDLIFSCRNRRLFFSGEMIALLISHFPSLEIIVALKKYFLDLILTKDSNKINNIRKNRQNLIKELFEYFRNEYISPYITIEIADLYIHLLYLEDNQSQSNYISALFNKNILDVIVSKLSSNNSQLIIILIKLLKSLTNKIEDSNVRSSFSKNIYNLIKNFTKILKDNIYHRNQKLIENLLLVNINFIAKIKENQIFYSKDFNLIKNESFIAALKNLFFDNIYQKENFHNKENLLEKLKDQFNLDIKILILFMGLIKKNKSIKFIFKDKNELDFFYIKAYLKEEENYINKFQNKIKSLSVIIKDKIIFKFLTNETNSFANFVSAFGFKIVILFYEFLTNIITFIFLLLNEEDENNKENYPFLYDLIELIETIKELLHSFPYNLNKDVINERKTRDLNKLISSCEALDKYLIKDF